LDCTTRIFHPTTNSALGIFKHEDMIICLSFNPYACQKFIVGTFDCEVFYWDIESNFILNIFKFQSPPTACVFSPDGYMIAIGLMNVNCFFIILNHFHISLKSLLDHKEKSN
jgi:WD40 repeat protein